MQRLVKDTNVFSEFDSELNPKVDVGVINENSAVIITWRCNKDPRHIWDESARRRCIQAYGCPYCSGHRTIRDESIAVLRPDLLEDWDVEKNGDLDPYSIPKSSNKIVHWKCSHGHEWVQQVINRYRSKSGCKICRKFNNSLYVKYPEISRDWHKELNGSLTAKDDSAHAHLRAHWQCPDNPDHTWQARVDTRTKKGSNCPHCRKRTVPNSQHLKLPSLSEYSRKLSKEWHPTKNGSVTPSDVTAGSNRKVWWQCSVNHNHEWQATVNRRARKNSACPLCSHPKNSLAKNRPDLIPYWHSNKNHDLSPANVSCGSAKRVWWSCLNEDKHEWQERVYDVCKKKATLCPQCRKISNTLEYNYPEIASEWHHLKNGDLSPREITKANDKKVWWLCSNNPDHEWQAEVKNRTIIGSGCPICAKEWNASRAHQNIVESAYLNTQSFKIFISNLNSLRKILEKEKLMESSIKQHFFRMLYGSGIANLETYLSDAFFNLVVEKNANIESLLLNSIDLKNKKYSPSEIIDWKNKPTELIADYVYNDVLWHNLSKVMHLFSSVLGVNFQGNSEDVFKAISIRHDLVHRNGKDKSGISHKLDKEIIASLFDDLIDFVKGLDQETKKLIKSDSG